MNLIVGDSHTTYIKFENSVHLLCSGGSAKGLGNYNSISQYNKLIIDNVSNNNYDHLFFLFGNVDIDFLFIDKFLDDNNINYIDYNSNIIDNYLKFITENFLNKSITILTIGLPVLDDDNLKKSILYNQVNWHGESHYNDLKTEKLLNAKLPDIYERTKITLDFNEQLKKKIIQLDMCNINCLDITTFTYDINLKRIKDDFFSRNDHHNFKRNLYYNHIISNFLQRGQN